MISGEAAPSPYLTILWHPRWTIRRIVDTDPRGRVLLIVAVAALLAALAELISSSPTASTVAGIPIASTLPIQAIRVAALLLLPPLAIAMLYLEGGLIRWAGALLGGSAQSAEVRAALAWARIPALAGSLAILLLAAMGMRVPPFTLNPAMMVQPLLRLGGMSVLCVAWELVLAMGTIAEVHRFSPWKSIAACAIALFTFAGAVTVAGLTLILAAIPLIG